MFSYTTGICVNILIFIVLAVSLNITVGLMGQLSLGHAGFVAIGAYSSALVSKAMVPMGLPAFAQIVISSLIGGVIATFFWTDSRIGQ